jgi:MFS family permease
LGGCGPLALGILIWSLATAAIGILLHPSPIAPPIPTLIAAHAIFGLSQSILMPGVSATASRWFPPSQRGLKTSTVYSWYNVGNVVGLAALPALSIGFGWATGYLLVGGVGTAVSIAALRWVVPQSYLPTSRVDSHRTIELHKPFDRALLLLTKYHKEIALLSWTHAVIALGFFVLQAWVPLYILSLPPHPSTSTTSFATVGLFSAAPWLATAVTARFAGQLADWLHTSKRMTSLAVRRWMQITSHFGGSLAMLLLALLPSFQSIIPSSRELALALLCLAIATQGLNYAGFHSYIQDVAPGDAGLILGLTNSCSILAGILGNLIMFHLASVPGPTGYGSLFAIMSLAYCASGAAWAWGARGRSIKL